MSRSEIGPQICFVKDKILPALEKSGTVPIENVAGHWVTSLPVRKQLPIGTSLFGLETQEINVRLDHTVQVDVFPVSIADFFHFVQSGDYFNKDFWPRRDREKKMQFSGGDKIIREILRPIHYDYSKEELMHIPVTNITWFQAYAYAKSKGQFLLNEMIWELAAAGSREKKKSSMEKIIQRAKKTKNNIELASFSHYACWGMLGGVNEWCGDQYEHAAFSNFNDDPLSLTNDEKIKVTDSVNVRGFEIGAVETMKSTNISKRRHAKPLDSDWSTGFRCCKIKY